MGDYGKRNLPTFAILDNQCYMEIDVVVKFFIYQTLRKFFFYFLARKKINIKYMDYETQSNNYKIKF